MRTLFVQQPGEEIREVEDFPTYWVSSLGRIISSPKSIQSRQNNWIVLRLSLDKWGYQMVIFIRDNHRYKRQVHDLVGRAFNDFSGPGDQWRHFPDSDKTNNRADNLIWGTQFENRWDRICGEGRQEDWGLSCKRNSWQLEMSIPGEGRKYIGVFPTMESAREERGRLCILHDMVNRL